MQAIGLQDNPQSSAIRCTIVTFFYRNNSDGSSVEYFWKPGNETTIRCYLIPMMNAGDTDLVFENSRTYMWKRMPEEMKWIIKTTPKAKIQPSLPGHYIWKPEHLQHRIQPP
ncbi:hypothetical protein M758_UG055100 [Ceratodon purpureus]|nr:hypothetical protein M758_UG055100 [Ceratodon purpureus]